MNCPSCNENRLRYIQRRPSDSKQRADWKRTDFKAKCQKCGWEGMG